MLRLCVADVHIVDLIVNLSVIVFLNLSIFMMYQYERRFDEAPFSLPLLLL